MCSGRQTPSPRPGEVAERIAQGYLEARGFRLVQANYRSRRGEIDLIMRQGQLLVFAEVRLRNRRDFGGAAASVTRTKQEKIVACAQSFLQHHPELSSCNCRFDVLAVEAASQGWNVDWLPAAFTT